MYLPKFTILSPGDRTNSNPLYPKMLCSKLVKFDYWEKDSIKSINRISIQIYTQNTDLWEHCKHCWHCHRKTVTFFLTHPKILKIISFIVHKKKLHFYQLILHRTTRKTVIFLTNASALGTPLEVNLHISSCFFSVSFFMICPGL